MNTQDQDMTQPPAAVTLKRADIAEEARLWRRSGLRMLAVQAAALGLCLLLIALVPAGPANDAVVVSAIVTTAILGVAVAFSMGYAHALTTKLKLR